MTNILSKKKNLCLDLRLTQADNSSAVSVCIRAAVTEYKNNK